MDHIDHMPGEPATLLARLDRMVAMGRITSEEATRVRAARDEAEKHAALTAIRVRHVQDRVEAALAEGRIEPDEADDVLRRLAEGEDPTVVHRLLRGLIEGRDRR